MQEGDFTLLPAAEGLPAVYGPEDSLGPDKRVEVDAATSPLPLDELEVLQGGGAEEGSSRGTLRSRRSALRGSEDEGVKDAFGEALALQEEGVEGATRFPDEKAVEAPIAAESPEDSSSTSSSGSASLGPVLLAGLCLQDVGAGACLRQGELR